MRISVGLRALVLAVACAVAGGVGGRAQPRIDPHNMSLMAGHRSAGPAVSLSLADEGLYRVTYEDLRAAGWPVDTSDPRRWALTVVGMPVAVHVAGEEDGRFDRGDFLEFFGTPFSGERLSSLFQPAMTRPGPSDNWLWQCRGQCRLSGIFEKYTTTNRYWLEESATPPVRMVSRPAPRSSAPIRTTTSITLRHEPARAWWSFYLTSEDTWFWDGIAGTFRTADGGGPPLPIERTYRIDIPHPDPLADSAEIALGLVSVTGAPGAPDYYVWVGLNGQELGTLIWDGSRAERGVWRVPGARLRPGGNDLTVRVLPTLANGSPVAQQSPDLLLDWLEVNYTRLLRADDDRLRVRVESGPGRTLDLSGFADPAVAVYDVTTPTAPVRVTGLQTERRGQDHGLRLPLTDRASRELLVQAAGATTRPSVAFHEAVRLPEAADYVVIAPAVFHEALVPLVRHREAQGLRVVVVNPDDLYRTFTFGVAHPIAFKSFLAHAFTSWRTPPRYLLLVGSGHWNLRGSPNYKSPPVWMPPNLALVDPWQGEVDSANMLATLVGEDAVADVAVGRLPAASADEVARYVAKVLAYETSSSTGEWTRRMLWLADNVPDAGGDFEGSVARASALVTGGRPDVTVRTLTLNGYGCRAAGSDGCTRATNALLGSLREEGAVLLGFAGHASIDSWTNERVLRHVDVDRMQTAGRWPFLMSLTCLDGYWIHPNRDSIVRRMLVSPDGVIGAFSPSGLGLAYGHDFLMEGFLDALVHGERDAGALALAAWRRLHATGTRPDLLHTYTIFGDPALRLALPDQR